MLATDPKSCFLVMKTSVTDYRDTGAPGHRDTGTPGHAKRPGGRCQRHYRLMSLSIHVLEIGGQIALRALQDFHNRPPIRERECGAVAVATFVTREHLPHPPIDRGLRRGRQGIECVGADLVAAGILHQTSCEIELVQRASLRVAWARRGESPGKRRPALDAIG